MSADLFDALDDKDDKVPERTVACPQCRKPMRRIVGKMGPFWGCSGYPQCNARLYDRDGKPSKTPDERYRCPVCTRPLVKAEGRGNRRTPPAEQQDGSAAASQGYWYCLGYNKGCKVTLADDGGRPAQAWRCPQCGHLLKQRKGKAGLFWGCSQYPLCQASFPDRDGKPGLVRERSQKS